MVDHTVGQHIYLNRGDTRLTVPRTCSIVVEPGGSLTISGVPVVPAGGVLRTTYAARPTATVGSVLWKSSDSVIEAISDGSTWHEYYGSVPLHNDGFPTTVVNPQTAISVDTTKGGVYVAMDPALAGAGTSYELLVKSIPVAPYRVRLGLMVGAQWAGNPVGLLLRDSVGGKMETARMDLKQGFSVDRWSALDTLDSQPASDSINRYGGADLFLLEVEDDGADRIWRVGMAGRVVEVLRIANDDYFVPNQIGLFLIGASTSPPYITDCWALSWEEASS